MSYDSSCDGLAREFLQSDLDPLIESEVAALAQEIQDVIEAYLERTLGERIERRVTDERLPGVVEKEIRRLEAHLRDHERMMARGQPSFLADPVETERCLERWRGMVGKKRAELTELELAFVISAFS